MFTQAEADGQEVKVIPQALQICMGLVRARATHPCTVKFGGWGHDLDETPKGRTSIETYFFAKNSHNMELKYDVRCLLDAKGNREAHIKEAKS